MAKNREQENEGQLKERGELGGDMEQREPQVRKGSGQQTGGERGQKLDKEDREGYRSSEQKRQRGNHGGNR